MHSLHTLLGFAILFCTGVFACEGECIVQVTDAFLSNYTLPIHQALANLGDQISDMVRKSASQNSEVKPALPEHSIAYFEPVLTEYKKTSFESMKTAIFPSYFHGKCQQNGVNPPGCPNPNCPVVCGTSGSMVHFYPKLLSITFEDTSRRLTSLLAPSSSKYKQVEKLVAKAAGSEDYSSLSPLLKDLREIVDQFEDQLEGECGGVDHDSCSWESDMKEFMLTFP